MVNEYEPGKINAAGGLLKIPGKETGYGKRQESN
jgi:hypothetical protein